MNKLPKRVSLLAICVFFCHIIGFAQLTIKGLVTEKGTQIPVSFLQIVLYEYNSDKVINFANTNEVGEYVLVLEQNKGAFKLKTSSIVYENYERDIFVSEVNEKALIADFEVSIKSNELSEVIVTAKLPPIIVKKDTTIYHVQHWAKETDATLEQLLGRMPGFEISKEGEVTVDGKTVGMVLIDGKLISDNGAALITKSLSPKDVKSIEVRMKEQHRKFKQSLLDKNDLVVLDIKLKDDTNKGFFGKSELAAGFQDKTKLGGSANVFSLHKKINLHLIGETDAFGENGINLYSIKNLGDEAYQAIFEVPADYNRLTQNPEFEQEIYGFRNYIKHDLATLGFTAALPLNEKLNFFFGTFNSNNSQNTADKFRLIYTDTQTGLSSYYENQHALERWASKNKFEVKYDLPNIKMAYDLNFIVENKQNENIDRDNISTKNYTFYNPLLEKETYQNSLFEWKIKEGIVFSNKALYSISKIHDGRNIIHTDSAYIAYYHTQNGDLATDIKQQIAIKQRKLLLHSSLSFDSKWGTFSLGNRFLRQKIDVSKMALSQGQALGNNFFDNSIEDPKHFQQWRPFIEHRVVLGTLVLVNELGYSFNNYPAETAASKKWAKFLEISSNLNFNFDESNDIIISYKQQVSAFPLYETFKGNDIYNFNTFSTNNTSLEPRLERLITASAETSLLYSLGIGLSAYALWGASQNGSRYTTFADAPFLAIIPDQLENSYVVGGLKIGKVFDKMPITILVEPSFIKNWATNISKNGQSYATSTERRLLKVVLRSDFEEPSNFSFKVTSNYNEYKFINEQISQSNTQKMLSISLDIDKDFFQEKLHLETELRRVNFFGNYKTQIFNVDMFCKYKLKKLLVQVNIHNLLDNVYFSKQSLQPLFLSISESALFSRYVKLGVGFQF